MCRRLLSEDILPMFVPDLASGTSRERIMFLSLFFHCVVAFQLPPELSMIFESDVHDGNSTDV